MKIAVYPGSFDPVTVGHMDVIRRGAQMFDKLIVAVLVNENKKPTFPLEQRVAFLEKSIAAAGLENVEVDAFAGLLADYTRKVQACTIVRGLRAMSDFEYEFQMALANRELNPNVDTVFLVTNTEYMYLSSSLVRQIGHFGGNIAKFVPEVVAEDVAKVLLKDQKQ